MALDDVVSSVNPSRERFEEATYRTTRWFDRCLSAHERPGDQNLFPIVQGGLDRELRAISLRQLMECGPFTSHLQHLNCASNPMQVRLSCMMLRRQRPPSSMILMAECI